MHFTSCPHLGGGAKGWEEGKVTRLATGRRDEGGGGEGCCPGFDAPPQYAPDTPTTALTSP